MMYLMINGGCGHTEVNKTLRKDGRHVETAIATSVDINPTSQIKNIQLYNKENDLKAKQNNCRCVVLGGHKLLSCAVESVWEGRESEGQ